MKRKVIKIKARIKDKPKKENTVDKEQLYKYALEWAEFKYSEEIRREDSIIQQSSNMQTAFSVISAALVMVAPVMVDNRGRLPLEFFLVAFSTIILSLMLSLLFATIAQKRKPQMMVNYVEKETKYDLVLYIARSLCNVVYYSYVYFNIYIRRIKMCDKNEDEEILTLNPNPVCENFTLNQSKENSNDNNTTDEKSDDHK